MTQRTAGTLTNVNRDKIKTNGRRTTNDLASGYFFLHMKKWFEFVYLHKRAGLESPKSCSLWVPQNSSNWSLVKLIQYLYGTNGMEPVQSKWKPLRIRVIVRLISHLSRMTQVKNEWLVLNKVWNLNSECSIRIQTIIQCIKTAHCGLFNHTMFQFVVKFCVSDNRRTF